MRKTLTLLAATAFIGAAGGAASAATASANVSLATSTGPGASVGAISFADSPAGARITVSLHGLPPGQHGFHVHDNPSCGATHPTHQGPDGPVADPPVPAGGAGAHFDPAMTKMHMGPEGAGHLGDLPFLTVAADGTDNETLIAPHIKDVSVLKGHAVMIHEGGDNYADQPKPLGGGGGRIACGVIG